MRQRGNGQRVEQREDEEDEENDMRVNKDVKVIKKKDGDDDGDDILRETPTGSLDGRWFGLTRIGHVTPTFIFFFHF